jgi:hypothetical protein
MTNELTMTGKNPDAPTIARLSNAPSKITIMLSSGVLTPKDRRPDMRMSRSETIKNNYCQCNSFAAPSDLSIAKNADDRFHKFFLK